MTDDPTVPGAVPVDPTEGLLPPEPGARPRGTRRTANAALPSSPPPPEEPGAPEESPVAPVPEREHPTVPPVPLNFDPNLHLIDLGRVDRKTGEHIPAMYLGVAARVKWFRAHHPLWTIRTELLQCDLDYRVNPNNSPGFALALTTITDEAGRLIACAHGTELRHNFADFIEKAETAAVGRALAIAGFGTPMDTVLDEGRIRDTPRIQRGPAGAPPPREHYRQPGSGRVSTPEPPPPPNQPPAPRSRAEEELDYLAGFASTLNTTLPAVCSEMGWDHARLLYDEVLRRSVYDLLETRRRDSAPG